MATVQPRVLVTPRGFPRARIASRRRARVSAVAVKGVSSFGVAKSHENVFVSLGSLFSSRRSTRRRPVTNAVDEDRTAASRARLDTIQADALSQNFVEDPGERGTVDMFSGLNVTKDVLTYWESQHAFFFPRLLLFSMTALGLAASVPQSLGGLIRGDDDGLSVLGTNVLLLTIAAAVTVNDLSTRKKDLSRLQRELALGEMVVIQRDKFRNERTFPLLSLRQAARVAIVYGDAEKVSTDLAAATPFRRRLEQSRILVVPVVERGGDVGDVNRQTDGVADVGPGRWELLMDVVNAFPGAGAGRWLAWPTKNDAWAGYFRRLLQSAGVDSATELKKGGYVTLGVTGQVRGSGAGSPNWDVLLSTFPRNRPGNTQDAAAEQAWRNATVDSAAVGSLGNIDGEKIELEKLKDIRAEGAARPIGTTLELPTEGPVAEVLHVHDAFYDALSRGDEAAMQNTWAPASKKVKAGNTTSSGVDFLVGKGAQLDGWNTVLRPDRRPEGLKLSDVDVTVEKNLATVTVLETVANGATLLATQSFEKDSESEKWILRSHYTIPYGLDTVAKIALRCDERGCVAVPAKAVASAPRE